MPRLTNFLLSFQKISKWIPSVASIGKRQGRPGVIKSHSHRQQPHGGRVVKHYYSAGLAAIMFGAAGGAFALSYEVASGSLRKKAERILQEFWPPAAPGKVDMISLDLKTCLPMPKETFNILNRSILSEPRESNTLLIYGEGGGGKFHLAWLVASLLRKKLSKHNNTILEFNGHTKESMEQGIIAAAKKLGMKGRAIDVNVAKSFLRTELFKKQGAIIIIRCLRAEAIINGIFPMQDVISGYLRGLIKPNVSIIYTTGQDEVVAKAKAYHFYEVSLSKAYTVDDLLFNIQTLPESSVLKKKVKKEGVAMVPLLVNEILENNPALARMAIPYLENTNTSIYDYINVLHREGGNAILNCSLRAINDRLADSLLRKIAELPQKATSIDALVESVHEKSQPNKLETYKRVAAVLNRLEKFGLVSIDPQNNCVYPLMLVSQARIFLREAPQPTAANGCGFWRGYLSSAPLKNINLLTPEAKEDQHLSAYEYIGRAFKGGSK